MADDLNGRFISPYLAKLRGSPTPNDLDIVPGLVYSRGRNWKEQRKFANHTLKKMMKGSQGIEKQTLEEISGLCSYINNADHNTLDVKEKFGIMSVSTFWKLCIGKNMKNNDRELNKLLSLLDDFFKAKGEPLNMFLELHPKLGSWARKLKLWSGEGAVVTCLSSFIQESFESLKDFNKETGESFLAKYMEFAKEQENQNKDSSFVGNMGYRNMKTVILDLVAASSDTISATLDWALLFMILHPEVQNRVQKELDERVGKGVQPLLSDRSQTPYTEAVLLEVQRVSMVADKSLPHRATKARSLSTGHYIPEGTMIIFWLGTVLRDKKIFPNPNTFNPDRFLDSAGNFIPNAKVVAFGLGQRRCPGEYLARAFMYMVFTGILSRFKIEKAHKNDYLSIIPQNGAVLNPMPFKAKFLQRFG